MTVLFTALIVLHGLIHLMGFAKAFGYADLPRLTQPISQGMGIVWLLATVLLVATGIAIWTSPRSWWVVGLAALVTSQVAIVGAWTDAKAGTVANVLLVVGVVFGYLAAGPASLRAQYDDDVRRGLARGRAASTVTDADLAHLPPPVARYLRLAGVVGNPRVVNMRARMHGRIRSGPDARWMPFEAEQYNFYDTPSRFFYLRARSFGIPIQGYHRFADLEATMVVKMAAAVPVARESGPDMTAAETVTLFNDMCLFAPATLIDPAIGWEPVDALRVRATFTHAGRTITADLVFNDAGELVDFRSDDRKQSTTDGSPMRTVPWSTPVRAYRTFGSFRLGSEGEGVWHEPGGSYAYIEMTLVDVTYNIGTP